MSNGFDYLSKWKSKKAKIDSLRSLQSDTTAIDTAATDLTDGAGRCTVVVAFKAANVPLEAADLANGVGAAPS